MDNEILLNSTLEQSICITAVAGQWRHQGGRPPVRGSTPPTCPPSQKKNGQTQPFLANFWIFAPSESHLAPSMPPTKKKILVPPLLQVLFVTGCTYALIFDLICMTTSVLLEPFAFTVDQYY